MVLSLSLSLSSSAFSLNQSLILDKLQAEKNKYRSRQMWTSNSLLMLIFGKWCLALTDYHMQLFLGVFPSCY